MKPEYADLSSKRAQPPFGEQPGALLFQPAREQWAFPMNGVSLGITICEDIWNDKTFWATPMYARDPVTELISQGTSVLLNISASPFTLDKRFLRLGMLRSLALHHRRPVWPGSLRSAGQPGMRREARTLSSSLPFMHRPTY